MRTKQGITVTLWPTVSITSPVKSGTGAMLIVLIIVLWLAFGLPHFVF